MRQQRTCANCGIAIDWQPTIAGGDVFCCAGCAQGGPCDCDYDNLPQPGAINPIVIQTPEERQRRGAS